MTKKISAREAAFALVAKRDYASETVYDKLVGKGYSEADSSEAVSRLIELGCVDDAAYAASVIRRLSGRGYGARRILQYLCTHGLSRSDAEEALEQNLSGAKAEEASAEAIDAFLRKRATAEPDSAEKRRLAAALMRRGFEWTDIREGFSRLGREDDE